MSGRTDNFEPKKPISKRYFRMAASYSAPQIPKRRALMRPAFM
jgi:hypothetical protein